MLSEALPSTLNANKAIIKRHICLSTFHEMHQWMKVLGTIYIYLENISLPHIFESKRGRKSRKKYNLNNLEKLNLKLKTRCEEN